MPPFENESNISKGNLLYDSMFHQTKKLESVSFSSINIFVLFEFWLTFVGLLIFNVYFHNKFDITNNYKGD